MNIIMAMNMGGDDFVAKPFDLSVLTAKIQALLRRTYDLSGKVPMLEHRGAILNLYDTTMTYNGEKIELTKNEFRILQTLMENKGRVVSRDTLMTKLWETDNYIEENTLTVNVGRLRKKLEKSGNGRLYQDESRRWIYHREGVKMFLQYLKRIRFVLLWSLLCAGIFFSDFCVGRD